MIGSMFFKLFLFFGLVSTLTADNNAKYKKCLSSDFSFTAEMKEYTPWCKKFCHATGYAEKYRSDKSYYDEPDEWIKVYNDAVDKAESNFLEWTTQHSYLLECRVQLC
ncbi:Uncharacterised protein at_DN1969 [Pycnogonum litorale]